MRVLQFGFDGDPSNPHLPHQHDTDAIVYTGTHDNDTTVGWYASLPESPATWCAATWARADHEVPDAHDPRGAGVRWRAWRCLPAQDLLKLGPRRA